MVNTVRDYDDSYSYGSVIHKRKSSELNKFYKLMGGILLLLSIFVLFKLSDHDGNWLISGICLIVAVALLFQIKGVDYGKI